MFCKQLRCTNWFTISEKSIMRSMFLHRCTSMHQKPQQGIQKLLSFGPVVYKYIWYIRTQWYIRTYIRTKGRNFKTFLKENYRYEIALDSWYLFTKKNVEHGTLDMSEFYNRFDKRHAI